MSGSGLEGGTPQIAEKSEGEMEVKVCECVCAYKKEDCV